MAAEKRLATMGVEDTVEERKKMVVRQDKRAAEQREQSGFAAVDADGDKREAICDAAGIGENRRSPRIC